MSSVLAVRRIALAIVGSLALLAAGCGGKSSGGSSGGGSVPESASLVPATAPFYLYVNTDFSGDQWSKLNALVDKFPDRAQVTSALQKQLSDQNLSWNEIKQALGPDTGAALL